MDTGQTLEFSSSPRQQIGLVLICIFCIALSFLLALSVYSEAPGSIDQFVGGIGLLFMIATAGLLIWAIAAGYGSVVTISPAGIRDKRFSEVTIPWSAIDSISVWSGEFVLLHLEPEFDKALQRTRIGIVARRWNRAVGVDGVLIGSVDQFGFDRMLKAIIAYATAWNPKLARMTEIAAQ